MALELHHLFILTGAGAPQADFLSDLGLIEGARNSHPGQGTANRRFFFSNTTLELLYLRDAEVAAKGPGNRLRIVDRTADCTASPFGLIANATSGSTDVTFPFWLYCPEYFPADQCFRVGKNSDRLTEPLCICMPPGFPFPKTQLRTENPDMTLTELRISVSVARPSPTLQAFANCDGVSLKLNEPHRLELIFNEEQEGLYKDLAPDLPLSIRW